MAHVHLLPTKLLRILWCSKKLWLVDMSNSLFRVTGIGLMPFPIIPCAGDRFHK